MLKENDIIKVHMIDWPRRREIKTRNHGQTFTITKHPKSGDLCIDWRRGMDPFAHTGSPLVPLTGFAWTVVFEHIDSGKLYHNNTFAEAVVELSPEYDELRRACAAGIANRPTIQSTQISPLIFVWFTPGIVLLLCRFRVINTLPKGKTTP